MARPAYFCLLAIASVPLFPATAAEDEVVFRSDVSLVRVDAQVLDRNNRAITGLTAEDFVLREEGKPQQIRNFSREELPVDVLMLLDVSGSMRSHIERISSASHQALQVLGPKDRVAIMVFDRSTRLRMPFRNSRSEIERGMEAVLNQETFDGGTDITRGMLDAAEYMSREGRRDARHAIVILTDDQTERGRDEAGVLRALTRADSVMSALLAPDAMGNRPWSRGGGGSWPSGTGGGGGGGPLGGPLGGIIWGRRGPGGGGGRGPVQMGGTHSAGTSEIAQRSGGDSLPVDAGSALETTFERIRQRYAIHFYLPEGVKPGQERAIEVELSEAGRRKYPSADVRYRRAYMAPGGSGTVNETVASTPVSENSEPVVDSEQPRGGFKRRPAVSEPSGGWRRGTPEDGPTSPPVADQPSTSQTPAAKPVSQPQAAPEGGWKRIGEPGGGWRRVKPGEEP